MLKPTPAGSSPSNRQLRNARVVEARTATRPRSRFSICRAGVAAAAARTGGAALTAALSNRRASNGSMRGRLRIGRMAGVLARTINWRRRPRIVPHLVERNLHVDRVGVGRALSAGDGLRVAQGV